MKVVCSNPIRSSFQLNHSLYISSSYRTELFIQIEFFIPLHTKLGKCTPIFLSTGLLGIKCFSQLMLQGFDVFLGTQQSVCNLCF